MKLEDLTIKEVCSCIAILNKMQQEGILTFDLKTTSATINTDNLTEYLGKQNVELKERINKAIEYIKERTEYNQYSEVYPSVLDAREVKNILKILRGE